MKYLYVMAGLAVAMAGATATGANPERVTVDTYEEFTQGTSKSVSLNEEGFLSRSPEVREIEQVAAGQVWAILPDTDGAYLMGTSPDGELLRVFQDGRKEIVTKFKEKQVTSLARNSKGELFAATSPDGKVYRLPANGKPEVYFDPKQKYIWDIGFGADDVLYLATGTDGKIFQVASQGRGKVYYDSDETHIFTLAWEPKTGALLAGSGDSGYLYRVTGEGKAVVLFSNGEKQINNIVVDSGGVIFFSALGGKKGGGSSGSSSSSARLNNLRQLMAAAAERAKQNGGSKPTISVSPSSSSDSKNGGGEASKIYRLDETLFAEAIWSTDATVYTMQERGGKLYLGTGEEGYFYELTKDGEATLLLQVDGQTISAVMPMDQDRFALATSNPIKLFLTGKPNSGGGVYESQVFDSNSFARWGAVTAKTDGGRVTIKTRSGNTPDPDKSWYDWQDLAPQSQPRSPSARFFQVQLKILEGEVDRFEFVYLPRNLPPRIEEVLILPSGVGFQAIVPPPQPPAPRSIGQLLKIEEDEDPESLRRTYNVRFQPTLARGLRTAVWKVSDPNNDELRFTVYYREDKDEKWHLLAEDLEEPVISWDSSGWPDGRYYLKVKATDAEDNAPEDVQSHENKSKLLTVDNTPPKITIDSVAGGQVKFTVSDDASMLLSTTVSRNGYDFKPLRPSDGILDGKRETFTAELKAGELIFIRAEDEEGNVSSAQARGK